MSNSACPECVGLSECNLHPRWNVIRAYEMDVRNPLACPWWVYAPGEDEQRDEFETHADAIAYATSQARAEKVAAIQDGAA